MRGRFFKKLGLEQCGEPRSATRIIERLALVRARATNNGVSFARCLRYLERLPAESDCEPYDVALTPER